ncbi:MAG: hypothetical protein EON59_00600 [Alphaproteobacteria bacterium]|nr:MAG: hypothetical protein EON59_00600 [Alphaproteobacteria bacterium]
MTSLAYGTSAYSRERGNLPDLPLVNLFVEASPTTAKGVMLQSRPPLVAAGTVGSGPIRGIFQADGVLGGAQFVVSGSSLYKDGALHGEITGTGPVSFAASQTELLINAGAAIHHTDGTTFSTVSFPDAANVIRVLFLAGYFVAIRKDTHQFYWSDVLDGLTWDGLSFASAENNHDNLLDALVLSDSLVLIGSKSVEFWPATGDPDAPFAPTQGRVFERGIIATGCAVIHDNSFAWIGDNGIVYISGNVPERLSDSGIEERIAQSATWSLFGFPMEGHDLIAVRLDSGTWLRDAQTQQWCEFASYGRDNWRARCSARDGSLFGDDETGALWTFGAGYIDAGGPFERRFRAGQPISGGSFSIDNVRLAVNVGETSALTGYTAEPTVEMRTTRDAGRTWGPWRATSLGAQGHYRTRCEWRRCGMFDDPGFLAEFRTADTVPFRVSDVGVNEAGGGRAR